MVRRSARGKRRRRGRALAAVAVAIIATTVGAFAVQYYTWTIPTVVKPMTFTITEDLENISGATTGLHIYGSPADGSSAAIPASDSVNASKMARVALQKDAYLVLYMSDATCTSLLAGFDDLTITIGVYEKDNVSVTPFDVLTLTPVVEGVAQTNVYDNTVTLSSAKVWDCVIRTTYETVAVISNTSTLNIELRVRAVQV